MFTPREQQIINLWEKLATAFNTITNEGNTWTISGGDYPDGPQFDSKEELIECIETDIKEWLLNAALNGELNELNI